MVTVVLQSGDAAGGSRRGGEGAGSAARDSIMEGCERQLLEAGSSAGDDNGNDSNINENNINNFHQKMHLNYDNNNHNLHRQTHLFCSGQQPSKPLPELSSVFAQ